MRGDQRLERDKPEATRRCIARFGTGVALALVLASAAAPSRAADRPEIRYPEAIPTLPEPEPSPEVPVMAPSLPAPRELRLLWFDPKGLFPPAYESVSREVRRIFKGVGVDLR